jgi:hypothetical protein
MSLALILILIAVILIALSACGVGGKVDLFKLGIAVALASLLAPILG